MEFVERRLEDVVQRLNRFERADEKPFEAVAAVSEFNQRAYELFAQPLVQAIVERARREAAARRSIRCASSAGRSPTSIRGWLARAGGAGGEGAAPARSAPDAPARKAERAMSEHGERVARLLPRACATPSSEAAFFQIYGNLFSLYLADRPERRQPERAQTVDPRELPVVKEALAAIDQGGYAEALARVGALLAPARASRCRSSRLQLRHELIEDYRDAAARDCRPTSSGASAASRTSSSRYERERAVATLPALAQERRRPERLLTLFERVLADKRIQGMEATAEQRAMFETHRNGAARRSRDARAASAPVKLQRDA